MRRIYAGVHIACAPWPPNGHPAHRIYASINKERLPPQPSAPRAHRLSTAYQEQNLIEIERKGKRREKEG